VLEVPVNHRPRRFGTSHYGLRNRLVTTFADMLAMRVLKSRRLRYELAKDE